MEKSVRFGSAVVRGVFACARACIFSLAFIPICHNYRPTLKLILCVVRGVCAFVGSESRRRRVNVSVASVVVLNIFSCFCGGSEVATAANGHRFPI